MAKMWMILFVVLLTERTLGEEDAEDARGRSCQPFNRVNDKIEETLGPLNSYLNYCPVLDTSAYLPDNAHSTGGGRREGYEVHFHCNEGYVACGSSTAICGKDGKWSVEGDMFCVNESDTIWTNVVESSNPLPCVASIGAKIVLTGKPKSRKSFVLNIVDIDNNIPLHSHIRMYYHDLVIDTKINGNYKNSIVLESSFRAGVYFVMEVELRESGFQITVDGEVKYTDYPYYGGDVTGWELTGDWETATVTYILP